MKTKDIVTLVIATLIIGGSIFVILMLLNPSSGQKAAESTEADQIETVSTQFDETTLKKIQSLSDYGKPALNNIGKSDLFANY